MAKRIIMIHGRNFKPQADVLQENWFAATRHGIEREHGPQAAAAFDAVEKDMVYYGNYSNEFLTEQGKTYDEAEDVIDRNNVLQTLKNYDSSEFNKENYNNLPGMTPIKEALADAFAGVLSIFGVARSLIAAVAPDMEHYWDQDEAFGSDVRWTLTEPLHDAIVNNDDIMLVSHSLGTLIAYDVLWKFSHYAEYQHIRDRKITALMTLGSPLGDETVKQNLKGASAEGPRRYPSNIGMWVNVAAEDDYISHDQRITNDYRDMFDYGLVDGIVDHRTHNLSVRHGKSNPHHATGYLLDPVVADTIAEWLMT